MATEDIYEDTIGKLLQQSFWQSFGATIFKILLIVVISKVVVWIIHKSINRIFLGKIQERHQSQSRRLTTVAKLLKNTVSYTIYFIMSLLVLSEVGISLGPLLAGAGIAGVAIGFGAQSLVKDVITGFFIVLEDQFAVGDIIQTGSFKGRVEVIGLRTTKLISETGEMHIIPNSAINQVTNYSVHSIKLSFDYRVKFDSEAKAEIRKLKQAIEQLKHEHIIGSLTVLGIQHIDQDDLVLRIEGLSKIEHRDEVERAVNKLLADYKDRLEIEQN